VGSIFYEARAKLFDQAPEARDMCPPVRRIQRRIAPAGNLLHYPIEPRDLMRWPKTRLAMALAGLLGSRFVIRRDGTLEAACLNRLGKPFFEGTGLRSYITRFHHTPPSELDEDFFFRRMGFIEKATRPAALLRSGWRALRRKPFRKGAPAPLRVRPPEGFDRLFAAIGDTLTRRGATICYNAGLARITSDGDQFVITTAAGTLRARSVVRALPLDTLHRALFDAPSGLKSLDLMTLFVSAGAVDEKAGNVLFNFHRDGRWKRITLYSRIYPELMQQREFFSAEVTLPVGWTPDPEAAFDDLKAHLEGLGMASDLRLEGHEIVDGAYPLYTPRYDDGLQKTLARIGGAGVVLVGRQGRFEYLPTANGTIRRVAEELAQAGLAAAQ
jgi:hypothetical protein